MSSTKKGSDLDKLIQQADNLSTAVDLPYLQQDLNILSGKLSYDAQQYFKSPPSIPNNDQPMRRDDGNNNLDQLTKATLLLGSQGKQIPKVESGLNKLTSASQVKSVEESEVELDVDAYCKKMRENMMMTLVEESRKSLVTSCIRNAQNRMEKDWKETKKHILDVLKSSGSDDITFPADKFSTNINTMEVCEQIRQNSTLSSDEALYAGEILKYHSECFDNYKHPNLSSMCLTSAYSMRNENIIRMWQMITKLSNINTPVEIDLRKAAGRTSSVFEDRFIRNALDFLQESFLEYVVKQVGSRLEDVTLGGVPGSYPALRMYVSQHLSTTSPVAYEDGDVDGLPVWPLIYVCLRSGLTSQVSAIANRARNSLGQELVSLIEECCKDGGRLTTSSKLKMQVMFKRVVATMNGDPYKKVCLAVMGGSDESDNEDHYSVIKKTEDYMWLKLVMALTENDSNTGNIITSKLGKLQIFFNELGESYFNAVQNPFLFLQVLMLSGQLERGIEFLSRVPHLLCHAVHVALVFYEQHMLLLSSSIHQPLLSQEPIDSSPTSRINITHLVRRYTNRFEVSDTREALAYYYFLRDVRTPNGDSVFLNCISELIIESGEYSSLLGYVDEDGKKHAGAIQQFHIDVDEIMSSVASISEDKGRLEVAVSLYELAENYSKAMDVMMRLIASCLSQKSSPGSERERIEMNAVNLANRYTKSNQTARNDSVIAFHLLLDLMTFFNKYHDQQIEDALMIILELKFIPQNEGEIESLVNRFSACSSYLKGSLANILIVYVDILTDLYVKPNNTLNFSQQRIQQLGNAVCAFAGKVPYHLTSDVYSKLTGLSRLTS